MKVFGLVLAGGRSRRFGTEKAAALLEGVPLIGHAAAVLTGRCDRVAINAAPGSFAAHWASERQLPCLLDREDHPAGPLSGVWAGLVWAERLAGDLLVTVPCDTPRLSQDLVERLSAVIGCADVAVVVGPDGSHPLCAAWRPLLRERLTLALAQGHPPVRRFLEGCTVRNLIVDDTSTLLNVNTKEELSKLGCR